MNPADNDGLEEGYESSGYNSSLELGPAVISPNSKIVNNKKLRPSLALNKTTLLISSATVLFILVVGLGSYGISTLTSRVSGSSPENIDQLAAAYGGGSLNLQDLKQSSQLNVGETDHLSINGILQVNKTIVLTPTTTPSNPTAGQIYYNQTSNQPYYYNGSQFIALVSSSPQGVTSISGSSGAVVLGNGLQIAGNQLAISSSFLQRVSNLGINGPTVTSVQGFSGKISIIGTGNQVVVSAASGNVSLSLPQSIGLNSNVQFGSLALGSGGLTLTPSALLNTDNISTINNGDSLVINSGNNITFENSNGANSFVFPTSGGPGQTICTTGISCASGGGQAVILEPSSVQTANSNHTALFINKASGTGNLAELQANGTDAFVITNGGDTTITNLDVSNILNANNIVPTGAFSVGASNSSFTLQGNTNSTITTTGSGITTTLGFSEGSGGSAPNGNVIYQLQNNNTIPSGTYSICTTVGNCAGAVGVESLDLLTGTLALANSSGSGSTVTIDDASTIAKGIAEFNSTNFTAGGGIVNTVQNINSAATPTFGGLTLGTALSVANGGSGESTLGINGILFGNNANAIQVTSAAANSVLATNGTDVPSLVQTLPFGVQTNITRTGTLTTGSIGSGFGAISTGNNITTTSAIQGGSLNIASGAFSVDGSGNVSTTGTATIQGAGGLTLGVAGPSGTTGSLTFLNSTDATTGQFGFAAQTDNLIVTVPNDTHGSDNVCLETLANCVGTGGGIAGTGTSGDVAVFTGASNIGNSNIFESGSDVSVGDATPSALFNVGNSNQFQVTAAGAVLAVGVNAGSGSIQGTGGLNVTGAASIGGGLNNNSGNITNVGSLTGVTGITASGNINTTAGAFELNGSNINTGGVLNNVAYLNQDNTFTAAGTDITVNNNEIVGGTLTVQSSAGLILGVAGPSGTTGSLVLDNSGNSHSTILQGLSSATQNQTITIPVSTASTDQICLLTLANCSGSNGGSGNTNYIENQTSPQGNANFNIQGIGGSVSAVIEGAAGQDIADFDNSGGGILYAFNATGNINIGVAGPSGTTGSLTFLNSTDATTGQFGFAAQTDNLIVTVPNDTHGSDNVCLETLANCVGTGGGIAGTGTSGDVAVFTGASNIGNSNIFESGSDVSVGDATPSALFNVGNSNQFQVTAAGAVLAVGVNAGSGSIQGTGGLNVTGAASIGGGLNNNSGNITNVGSLTGVTGITASGTASITSTNTSGPILSVGDNLLTTTNSSLENLTFTNANSGVTATTVNGLSITPTGTSGGSNVLNSVNLPDVTPEAGNVFNALDIGTGYNSLLTYNGNSLINGSGLLQNVALSGTYSGLSGTGTLTTGSIGSGFGAISTGNNITTTSAIQGGSLNIASGAFSVDGSGNVSTTGTATIQGAGGLTLGVAGPSGTTGSLTFLNSTDATTGQFGFAAQTDNLIVTVPNDTHGSDNVCLETLANCVGTGGGIAGTGTSGDVAVFTGASNIGNSNIFESGSDVSVGDATPSALFNVGNSNQFQVTAAGAVLAVGVNAGSGSIQGTGGLNVTGAASIGGGLNNNSGNITNVGSLTGVTGITASGNINTTAGAFELNGSNINTGGVLNNVAYLNQDNTFTAAGTDITVNNNEIVGGTLTVQSSAGLILGVAGPSGTTGAITLLNSTNSNTVTLQTLAQGGNLALTIPVDANSGDVICLQALNNCAGSGSGSYINNAITIQSGNFNVQAATSGTVAGKLEANSSGTADILDLLNGSGVNVGTIGSSGATLLQNSTNSTTAFQIQNATTASVLNVNTTSSIVTVTAANPDTASLVLANSDATAGIEFRSGGSGGLNTFIGNSAGAVNVVNTGASTGMYNAALGYQALAANTSGYVNTAVGYNALTDNNTGYSNTGVGTNSISDNTSGYNNAALGDSSLNDNGNGFENTAIGVNALQVNNLGGTGGDYNSGVGYDALNAVNAGSYNTALGYGAGAAIISGSNNTFLGSLAGLIDPTTNFVTTSALQNATAIGNDAEVQASNSLVLGGSGSNSVNVGIGTTLPQNTLSVSPVYYSAGAAEVTTSGTTVTGVSGTAWTSAMDGMQFIFANGQTGTIVSVASATSLTLNATQPITAASAYRIQNTGFQVTSVGNVGIGTAAPTAQLTVGDSTTNTATILAVGSTNDTASTVLDVTSANGNVVGQFLGDGTVNLGGNGTTKNYGLTTLGNTNAGGYVGIITGQQITTTAGGSLDSLSTYITGVDPAPNNQYQLAIYADNSGVPGAYIASSAVSTLIPNSWNTLAVNTNLAASTKYWIIYWTNDTATANDQIYNTGVSGANWYYSTSTFGAGPDNGMPATFPAGLAVPNLQTSFYATISDSSSAFSLNGSTGAALFQNSSNTSSAFRVQNSGGTNLFAIDTSGNNLNIGATGATALASTVNVANSSGAVQTVNVGSTDSTSTTTIQGGVNGSTATLLLQDAGAGVITIGSQTASTVNTINIGAVGSTTNADGVNINSTTGANAGNTTIGGTNNTGNLLLQGEGITNTITGGATPSETIKTSTNSATAFQIQNSGNNSELTVDTSGNQVVLGKANTGGLNGTLEFLNNSNTNTATLQSGVTSSTYSLALPTAGVSGSSCLESTGGSTTAATALQFGACTGPKSVTKIVAMGTPSGCGGAAPVASSNPSGADFVVPGTSCTTADVTIQSAISALPAGGGVVYLEDGTYIISSSITIPSNVTLEGAGADTIIKLENSFSGTINMLSVSGSVSNVLIQDLKIDGNKANQSTGTDVGININTSGSPGATITNAWVQNMYGTINGDTGISLANSGLDTVTNTNVTGDSYDGIEDGNNNSTISDTTSSSNGGYGFNISGNYVTLNGDQALSNTNFGFDDSGANNSFTGNTSKSNSSYGFYLGGNDLTVSDNISTANTSDGIEVADTNSTINGNDVFNNGGNGIDIPLGAGTHNVISNNTISESSSGTTYGVYVAPNNNSVTGNNIIGTGGSGNAIYIYSGAYNTYLSNNTYSGTGATTISDNGGNTEYGAQISANNDIVLQGQGAIDVGSSAQGTGTLSVTGGIVTSQLATPGWGSLGSVSTVGGGSGTTWGYEITALDGTGETIGSTQKITSGPASLSGVNYNMVTFPIESGAVKYNVYRTAAPSTTGLVTSITAGTLAATNGTASQYTLGLIQWNDTGFTATTAIPTVNTTGGGSFAGPLLVKTASNTTTALQVENSSSKAILSVDTAGNQVLLGTVGTSGQSGQIVFNSATSGNFAVTLNTSTSETASYTLTLPTSGPGASQCLQSGASTFSQLIFGSCGSGSTTTLQQAYNNSAGAAPSIDMTSTNKGFTVQNDNSSPITGELFGVHASTGSGLGSGLFTVSNTGDTTITSSDTTTTGTAALNVISSATSGNALAVSANGITTGFGATITSTSPSQTAGSLLNVSDNVTLATNAGTLSGQLVNVSRALTANIPGGGSNTVTEDTTNGTYSFHTTGSGVTSPWSNSFDVGTNSNRYLIVDIAEGACQQPTGITYNSSSMTLFGTTAPMSDDTNGCIFTYGLAAPSTGTNNIVVTPFGGLPSVYEMTVSSWYNVSSVGTYTGSNGTTTSSVSVAAVSVSGQVVVDAYNEYVGSSGSPATPGGGQTQISSDEDYASTNMEMGMSYKAAVSTSTTMSWSGLTPYITYINSEAALGLNPTSTSVSETVSSPVASFSNNCSLTAGSCTDASNVLSLNQQYTAATGAVLNIQNAGTGDMLDLVSGSTTVVKINNNGGATFEDNAAGGSTTAFQIQNTGGSNVLNVDTTDGYVIVGEGAASHSTTADLLVLDNSSDTTEPTEVNGGMYYNSNTNSFRCGVNSAWQSCGPITGIVASDVPVSNTSAIDVTGLTFPVAASTNYTLSCNLVYQTAATTTGIRLGLNGPTSPTLVSGGFNTYVANAGSQSLVGSFFTAYGATTGTTAVGTANTNTPATLEATFRNGTTAGTLAVRVASSATSTVTIKAGSSCKLTQL